MDGNMPMDGVVEYFFLGRLVEQMFVVFGSFLWSTMFVQTRRLLRHGRER